MMVIHLYACIWVKVQEDKAVQGLPHALFVETSNHGKYAEAVYLMTTTISTVGYGDRDEHGFIDDTGSWTAEMICLTFMMMSGIILFSLVTNEIFTF